MFPLVQSYISGKETPVTSRQILPTNLESIILRHSNIRRHKGTVRSKSFRTDFSF
jgi:hypothetical protein